MNIEDILTRSHIQAVLALSSKRLHIQHREAQARIDKMIDNLYKAQSVSEIKQSNEEQLDEIWEMLGW